MEKLKIEYVPITELRTYPNNAKIHTEEQIEQIKASIQEFGFNDPVAVWNGELVEGHGRLIAAQELGFEELPVIRLDGLTDEQRRAYALVHNKLTMNTGFSFELLEMELESIDMDMEVFGFDVDTSEYIDNFFDETEGDGEAKAKDTVTIIIKVKIEEQEKLENLLDENGYEFSVVQK